jgi:hypothetical protein
MLGVYVVYPSKRFLAAKTRLFIDHFTSKFRDDPDRDVWFDQIRTPLPARSRTKQARRAAQV